MDGVPNSCFGIIERIYRKTLMMESFFKDFTISGFVQNFPILLKRKKIVQNNYQWLLLLTVFIKSMDLT